MALRKLVNSIFKRSGDKNICPNLMSSMEELQENINYKFKNIYLLKAALTHDSLITKLDDRSGIDTNYERMEFLGDAVLALVVCEHLFNIYPEKAEGDLSKIKSNIVSEKYLALQANQINLGDYILMSDKEEKNGGRQKNSIIADTVESIICAIYKDSGLKNAAKFINDFILKGFAEQILLKDLINYKSMLQEYSQGLYQDVPVYKIISETGPDHYKLFVIEVYINSILYGTGEGFSKKDAQQKAAQDACVKLKLN